MLIFLVLSFIRIALVSSLTTLWVKIKERTQSTENKSTLKFSVLIPVRNEESNIVDLLRDLENQDYQKHLYEVLVIDDHSEDKTADLVESFMGNTTMNLQLLKMNDADGAGKKGAITKGISRAKNDFILATDGDCSLPKTWIRSYADIYVAQDAPLMVTGPVRMETESLLTGLQCMEFSALIGYGAVSLSIEKPGTCNGANISYKKSAFLAVDGYKGNERIPSGDDEFLMLKIFRVFNKQVRFNKDTRALVTTPPKKTGKALVNQRIRWSSKWKFHKSIFITTSAVLFFVDYLFFLLAPMLIASINHGLVIILLTITIRWIVDYYYIINVLFYVLFM